MTCHNCETEMVKAGKYDKKAIQSCLCKKCGKRFSGPQNKPQTDSQKSVERQLQSLFLALTH